MTPDDVPNSVLAYRFSRAVGTVMDQALDETRTEILEEVDQRIAESRADHDAERHGIPRAPKSKPDEEHIPDDECARMIEAIEEEELTLPDLVERFDRARALIIRELAAYCRRHNRVQLARALQLS